MSRRPIANSKSKTQALAHRPAALSDGAIPGTPFLPSRPTRRQKLLLAGAISLELLWIALLLLLVVLGIKA